MLLPKLMLLCILKKIRLSFLKLDPFCMLCKSEYETVMHILWECPSTMDVWGSLGSNMQKCSSVGTTFDALLVFMFERGSIAEVELNAEIARRIWFRHNTVFHGGDFLPPTLVLKAAIDSIAAYRSVMEKNDDDGVSGTVSAASVSIP